MNDWKDFDSDYEHDFVHRDRSLLCTGLQHQQTSRIILFDPVFRGRWDKESDDEEVTVNEDQPAISLTWTTTEAKANVTSLASIFAEEIEEKKKPAWTEVKSPVEKRVPKVTKDRRDYTDARDNKARRRDDNSRWKTAENRPSSRDYTNNHAGDATRTARDNFRQRTIATQNPPPDSLSETRKVANSHPTPSSPVSTVSSIATVARDRTGTVESSDSEWKQAGVRNRRERATQCRFGDKCNKIKYGKSPGEVSNSAGSSVCMCIHPGESDGCYKRRVSISRDSKSPSLGSKSQLCRRGRQCSKSGCQFAHSTKELVVTDCPYRNCRYTKRDRDGNYSTVEGSRPCRHLHPKETLENYAARAC